MVLRCDAGEGGSALEVRFEVLQKVTMRISVLSDVQPVASAVQYTCYKSVSCYHHCLVQELQKYECATGFDLRSRFKSVTTVYSLHWTLLLLFIDLSLFHMHYMMGVCSAPGFK